jgi:phosphate transport system protein
MSRKTFHHDMQALLDKILLMGSRVEGALADSVRALKKRDHKTCRQIIAHDQTINEARYEIEGQTLMLIATQQPMARDLRILAAVLEIAGELERIGDYAKGIANISLMIGDDPLVKPLVDVPAMAGICADMLHRALDAFVQNDAKAAEAIAEEDDTIDVLYNQVYRELMTYVIADPKTIEQVNYLLWVAHNLERTADRVTNICERVIFTVTGELIDVGSENEGIESLG